MSTTDALLGQMLRGGWFVESFSHTTGLESIYRIRHVDTGRTARLRTVDEPGPDPIRLAVYSSWLHVEHPVWSPTIDVVRLPDHRPGLLIDDSIPPGWQPFDTLSLDPVAIARLAERLGSALIALHTEGIAYGPILPDQIYLPPDGRAAEVRVIGLSSSVEHGDVRSRRRLPSLDRDLPALGHLLLAHVPDDPHGAIASALRDLLVRATFADAVESSDLIALHTALGCLVRADSHALLERPTLEIQHSGGGAPRSSDDITGVDLEPGPGRGDDPVDTDEFSCTFDTLDHPDLVDRDPSEANAERRPGEQTDVTPPTAAAPTPTDVRVDDPEPDDGRRGPSADVTAELLPDLVVEGLRIPITQTCGHPGETWQVPTVVPGGTSIHRLTLRAGGARILGAALTDLDDCPLTGVESRITPTEHPWPLDVVGHATLDLELTFASDTPTASGGTLARLAFRVAGVDEPVAALLALPPVGSPATGTLVVEIGATALRCTTMAHGRLRHLPDARADGPSPLDRYAIELRPSADRDDLDELVERTLADVLATYRLAPKDTLVLPALEDDEHRVEQYRAMVRRLLPTTIIHFGLSSTVAAGLGESAHPRRLIVDIGGRTTRCVALNGDTVLAMGRIEGGGRALLRALATVTILGVDDEPAPAADADTIAELTPPSGVSQLFRLPTGVDRPCRASTPVALPWRTQAQAAHPTLQFDLTERLRRQIVALHTADRAALTDADRALERALRSETRQGVDNLCAPLAWSIDGAAPEPLATELLDRVTAALSEHPRRIETPLVDACQTIAVCAAGVAHAAWREDLADLRVLLTGRGERGAGLESHLSRYLTTPPRRLPENAGSSGAVRWRSQGYPTLWPSIDRLGFTLLQITPTPLTLVDANCRVRRAVSYLPVPASPVTLALAWGGDDPRLCASVDPPPASLGASALKVWVECDRRVGHRLIQVAYVTLPQSLDALADEIDDRRRNQPPMPCRDDGDGAVDAWWATPTPVVPGEQRLASTQITIDPAMIDRPRCVIEATHGGGEPVHASPVWDDDRATGPHRTLGASW